MLLNLMINAEQALASQQGNRSIAVRTVATTETVRIEVADTGPGVPEKARAHMFQAFQGAARAGGTGLGLAIAAELVRAHGGEIRLVPGTIGATFSITIPDRAVDLSTRRGERARA
jgi:signal transduction histidine kinase